MTLDISKPVKTKSGLAVRIISTDGNPHYPIVGFIEQDTIPSVWKANGSKFESGYITPGAHDLINVKTKKKGWINIYKSYNYLNYTVCYYETKDSADKGAAEHRIACIPIEWEE